MAKHFLNFEYAAVRPVRSPKWTVGRGHIQFNLGGTVSIRTRGKKFYLPDGDTAVIVELASGTQFIAPMKEADLKDAGYDMLSQDGEICNMRAKPESFTNIANQVNGIEF